MFHLHYLFNSLTILRGGYYHYHNFTGEEVEAKKVKATCSCRYGVVSPRFTVMLPTWGERSVLCCQLLQSRRQVQSAPGLRSCGPGCTQQGSGQGGCGKAWPFQPHEGHWQPRAPRGVGWGCVRPASHFFPHFSTQPCFCPALVKCWSLINFLHPEPCVSVRFRRIQPTALWGVTWQLSGDATS